MIFWILITVIGLIATYIIIGKYLEDFGLETMLLSFLGGGVVSFAGIIAVSILTVCFAYNGTENYNLISESKYNLIRQNFDNHIYYVKEVTENNIYYDFEYSIAETGKRVKTGENILINYEYHEKPNVVVSHYEPNGFLQFFTITHDRDYYTITLNNKMQVYMTLQ